MQTKLSEILSFSNKILSLGAEVTNQINEKNLRHYSKELGLFTLIKIFVFGFMVRKNLFTKSCIN
jgi:hypothetical protein